VGKSFSTLRDRMSPEARTRAQARTAKMLAEMALAEVLGRRFLIRHQRARRRGYFQG
jgi:hypothetical protein